LSGSWLARINSILETEAVIQSNKVYEYLPNALFKLLNTDPICDEGHFGIIWYLFIIVTVLALLLKDKLSLSLALGCWLWIAYLQWGVQSPDGAPIAKYIRYISMIVPIQCLVFGAILGRFLKISKKLKPVLIFLFVLLLIHLFWFGTRAANIVKVSTDDFKEIAKFLVGLELKNDDIIYTDGYTGDFVEVYSKGRLNILRVNNFKNLNQPEKGILVQYGSRDIFELPDNLIDSIMPDWYLSPPNHWPLIYTVCGKKLDIYEEFDPEIYRILPKK
jgi:hypothetical protein